MSSGRRPYLAPELCHATSTEWPTWVWRVLDATTAEHSEWLKSNLSGPPPFALLIWTDRPPQPDLDGIERQRHEGTLAALQRWVGSAAAQDRARAAQDDAGRGRFYRSPRKAGSAYGAAGEASGRKATPGGNRGRKPQKKLF